MDFFEYQADAKRRTSLLVFYYGLAVCLIIGAIYLVAAVWMVYSGAEEGLPPDLRDIWQPWMLFWTAVMVGGVIVLGTAYKVATLSGGGKSVARLMGGRPVDADTVDPSERRLMNIVEEMAIASGVPVPPVYIIEERGINAFAAGFNTSDAVIGVTRGSLERLDRSELQGVIAHEFSHILYGDMRLNIRLIGVLFGILLLAVIGRTVLYMGFYSGGGRRRRGSGGGRGGGGAQAAMMVLGIVLIAIGLIGVFFGRLIKSAISRQREFLADASSVQFTRNPAGLAGALKKIAEGSSRLDSVHAEEASHMFFANCLKSSMSGLLATHPPLAERIRRIDQSFGTDGAGKGAGHSPETARAAAGAGRAAVSGFAGSAGVSGAAAEDIADRIGTFGPESLGYASAMVGAIPGFVRSAVRTPHGARAAVYCLLLSREREAFERQKRRLNEKLKGPDRTSVQELSGPVRNLPVTARLPLVDLAMPALQQQEEEGYRLMKETVKFLISADNKVSIFEYALSRNLVRNLEPVFGKPERVPVSYHRVKPLIPHCLPLLALLARYGNEGDPGQAKADFGAGLEKLGADPASVPMPDTDADPVEILSKALDKLRRAEGRVKKQVVAACVASVFGNRKVTVEEAELLRAVADSLNCPLPPVMTS